MRRLFAGLSACAFCTGFAAPAAPLPAQFEVPTMKTSIYLGSVTLATSSFSRAEETYTATYDARVSPWSFWSESGTIAIVIVEDHYERLLRGETVELTGEALSKKGKPRHVTARAQPADAAGGKLKVRIDAGGTTLIFNGTYRLTVADAEPSALAPSAP